MASAYSTPKQFDNYVAPVNLELVNFVLSSKEQKFNYNIAKVEQTLSEFGQLGLVRDQDKEYLADRLNTMVSSMGNVRDVDWSDSNIERQITSTIRGAIDDRVRNDIAMSRKFTSFQQNVQALKEKNPEQYADANLNYALTKSGAIDWLQGGASSFGNLEYTPFVDVAAKQREILDKSISMKHGITREVVDPTDNTRYIETEHYGLTEYEVRNKVLSNLTPQEQKQLEINTWSTLGDSAPQVYDAYVAPRVKELADEKATLKLNFEGKTAAEKAIIKSKVAGIDAQLSNIEAVKKNPSQMHSFLGAENLIAGLAATYAPVETSFKYNDNPAARKALENANKNIKAATDGTGDYDLNNTGTLDVSTISKLTDTEKKNVDFAARAERELGNYQTQLKGTFNSAYNRLKPEEKTAFDIGYQQYIKEQGLEDNVTNKNSFMLEHSNGGMGNYYTPAEVVEAKRLDREYRKKLKIKNDNYNEALEEHTATSFQKIFTTLKGGGNSQIKMMDERGNRISMGEYLKGYDSVEDLPKEKRDFLMNSIYADLTLSQTKDFNGADVNATTNMNINRIAQLNGELDKDLPMLVNPEDIIFSEYSEGKDFEKMKKDMQLPSQMTRAQFDAHIKPLMSDWKFAMDNPSASPTTQWALEKARNIPFIGGLVDGVVNTVESIHANMGRSLGDRAVRHNLIIGGEGTKTRTALETAMAQGNFDQISLRADSVEDDDTINAALTNQAEIQETYRSKMAEDAGMFAQNNIIVVEPSGTREGENVPAFQELIRQSGGNLIKGRPINVEEDPTGDYYIAYQRDTVTENVDGENEKKTTTRSVKITKRDLEGGEFMKWVDQQSDRDRLNTQNTKEVSSNKIAFADAKSQRSYITGVGKMIGATSDREMAKFTNQGAKAAITQAHPEIFNHPQVGAVYQNLVNKMIDNSHLFRVNVIANEWDVYDMAVQYQEMEDGEMVWKNLAIMPTGIDDVTDTAAILDTAPQIFLYEYMDKLFTDMKNPETIAIVKDDLEILNKIFPQQ